MGIQSVIFMGGGPLRVLAIGTLGTLIGVSTAILIGGLAVAMVAIVVGLRVPVIRELRGQAAPALTRGGAALPPRASPMAPSDPRSIEL